MKIFPNRQYLQLTTLVLHLLLFRWYFANITQTSLITLHCVFCVFSVSDHDINGLQPEIKRFTLNKKAQHQLEIHQKAHRVTKASLVQVDGGEAVDVLHLPQRDVQFGAKHRGGAGLLRRCQNLLRLLTDGVQVFL